MFKEVMNMLNIWFLELRKLVIKDVTVSADKIKEDVTEIIEDTKEQLIKDGWAFIKEKENKLVFGKNGKRKYIKK